MDPKELRDKLYAATIHRPRRRWLSSVDPVQALLEEAASHRDRELILPCLWFALEDAHVSPAARRALSRQLALLPSEQVAALEAELPAAVPHGDPRTWRQLQPIDCQLAARLPDGWPIVALCALHRSGFVREVALTELAATPRADSLKFVLGRLNDWVPRVRETARAALNVFLRVEYASAWIDALGLVDALERARRADHGPTLNAIHALFLSPVCEPMMLASLSSADPKARRRSARIILGRPDLFEHVFHSRDAGLRLMALRAALAAASARDDLLEAALRDGALSVRRCAFVAAVARGLVDERRIVDDFLFDASITVRELARGWVRRNRPDFDVAGTYRRALAGESGRRQRVALVALGENGNAADLQLIEPFLHHPAPSVRRFAVLGMDALGSCAPGERFIPMLSDPAGSVARAAGDAIVERMEPALVPRIWTEVEKGTPAAATRAARCFVKLDTWSALVELSELIPRAPDECARQLGGWLRRHVTGFRTRPSAEVVERVTAALRWAHEKVPARVVREIEFVLRTSSLAIE
jgi:hypothetical protein